MLFHRPIQTTIQGGSLVEQGTRSLAGNPVFIEVGLRGAPGQISTRTAIGATGAASSSAIVSPSAAATSTTRLGSAKYELKGLDAEVRISESTQPSWWPRWPRAPAPIRC